MIFNLKCIIIKGNFHAQYVIENTKLIVHALSG